MSDRTTALVIAVLAATALGAMTARLAGADPTRLDERMQTAVHRWKWRHRRTFGLVLSGPGYPGFYFPVTALLIWLLRSRGAPGGVSLAIASVVGWATHRVIKLFAFRPRPDSMKGRSNELESFPSGHTTATTAIAIAVAWVFRHDGLISAPVALLIGIGLSLAIGSGRVISDEHWTTDVIGGWFGGIAAAALALSFFEPG